MTTYDERTLSVLVHAASKTGKTTFAASAPPPIVMLDAEGGTKFLPASPSLTEALGHPLRTVRWDPQHPPPRHDGSWDAAIVSVRDWQTVRLAYQWLATGDHDFHSLVVDSITEIQRRCREQLRGTEQMQIQDWGQLLSLMDAVIRKYRDLTIDPHNPIQVSVFVAETRRGNDGRWIPYMQGQISIALPYWMDIVSYLYVDNELDDNGQATRQVRRLLVGPDPQFESGERVQGAVGPIISDPNITTILQQIYPQATTTTGDTQ